MIATDTITEKLISGLNPQQEKAVTAPFDRHYLVLAGAGCGKTSVLTRRIAYCAHTLCEQHELLALTFTRKAAEEMRTRVMKLPGIDPEKEPPVVTTFHGFSLRVIRDIVAGTPNIRRLGYGGEPRLLSAKDRLRILASLTTREQRRELKKDILRIDDLLSKYVVNREKVRDVPEEVVAFLTDLANRFARRKIEENVWEFSDMITQAVALFSNYENIADHYADAFRYILVDEFQDTNPLQITLLNYLLSGKNRVFAVGDDDQAIYGFRGADIKPTLQFDECFPGAEVIKLETNYRSRPAILDCANKIFRDKPAQYRKILRSGKFGATGRDYGQVPEKRYFDTAQDMVQWIAKTVASLHKEEKIPVADMALLFRVNETLDLTSQLFKERNPHWNTVPGFMTVHGSKGLEFPVVFLCDLEESIFPSYRLEKKQQIQSWIELVKHLAASKKHHGIDCDFDEERRLFYVGVTRAERFLYLLSVRNKKVRGRKLFLEPSRFLKII